MYSFVLIILILGHMILNSSCLELKLQKGRDTRSKSSLIAQKYILAEKMKPDIKGSRRSLLLGTLRTIVDKKDIWLPTTDSCGDVNNDIESINYITKLLAFKTIYMQPLNNTATSITTEFTNNRSMVYLQGFLLQENGLVLSNFSMGSIFKMAVIHPTTSRLLRTYDLDPDHVTDQVLQLKQILQSSSIILLIAYIKEITPDIQELYKILDSQCDKTEPLTDIRQCQWIGFFNGTKLDDVVLLNQLPKKIFHEFIIRKRDTNWCGYPIKTNYEGWNKNNHPDDSYYGTLTITSHDALITLCSQYDGYGDLCKCPPKYPQTQTHHQSPISKDSIIIVLASRPGVLQKLLSSLVEKYHVPSNQVVVYSQKLPSLEMKLICRIYNVSIEPALREFFCDHLNAMKLYESALRATYIRFSSQFFMTLEEDTIVHPGYFKWMMHAKKKLRTTEDYLCVNSQEATVSFYIEQRVGITSENKILTKDFVIQPLKKHFKKHPSKKDASVKPKSDVLSTPQLGTNGFLNSQIAVASDLTNNSKTFRMIPGWGMDRNMIRVLLNEWETTYFDRGIEEFTFLWGGVDACLAPPESYTTHLSATESGYKGDIPPWGY